MFNTCTFIDELHVPVNTVASNETYTHQSSDNKPSSTTSSIHTNVTSHSEHHHHHTPDNYQDDNQSYADNNYKDVHDSNDPSFDSGGDCDDYIDY